MNEVYAEWLVKRKTPGYVYAVLPLGIVLGIVLFIVCVMLIPVVGYIVGLIPFVGLYYWYVNTKLEYEFIYVTGDLTIDKIISQNRRKRVVALDMANVATVADLSGHFLDGQMGNPQIKKYKYTSGEKDRKLFGVLYSEGGTSSIYIIEPNAKIIECIKKTNPRKVQM